MRGNPNTIICHTKLLQKPKQLTKQHPPPSLRASRKTCVAIYNKKLQKGVIWLF
ncbi:hypothetical protein [Helicobacter sp. T3_23-1056]